MEVTQIGKEIESLRRTAQENNLVDDSIGARSIKPLLNILNKLIDELNKTDPDRRRLNRLSIEAKEHWGSMAQAVLRDSKAGIEIDSRELNMVTDSKSLVDDLVQKADEKIAAQRDRKTNTSSTSVDSRPAAEQDSSMSDLSRQEVDAKLAQNRAEVDARLANFDTSIKTGFADLRADMAKMQSEMHKSTTDLIKWAAGLALAIVGATVGLLTYLNKSAEKPIPPPPTPIVIYAQPAPSAPATAQQPAK